MGLERGRDRFSKTKTITGRKSPGNGAESAGPSGRDLRPGSDAAEQLAIAQSCYQRGYNAPTQRGLLSALTPTPTPTSQTNTQATKKKNAVRTIDASTEEGKKALETLEAIAAKPKKGWNRMGVELGIVAPFVPSPKSIELLVDAKLLRKGRGGVLTPTEMGVRALETSSFDLSADMDFDENTIYVSIETKGIDKKTGIEKLNLKSAEGWNQISDIPMRYDYNVDNVRTYSCEWLSWTIWTQLHLPEVEYPDSDADSDADADSDSDSDSEKFFGSDWMQDLTGKESPDEVHALPVFVQLKVNPPSADDEEETQEDHVDVDRPGEYFNMYINCFHPNKTVDAKFGVPTVCGVTRDIPHGWALSHDSAYVHRAGQNRSGKNRYLAMVTWIACTRVGYKTYKMPPIPGLQSEGPKWHKALFERRTGLKLVFGTAGGAKKRKRK